jgi:AcrR family transcriptional regulator
MAVSGTGNRKSRPRRRGRPKGGDSDVTRERIVASACACFGARGYAATTNQEIADGAGVTSAAMYQYFDSKKDLYIAAVRNAHQLIVPHFREAIVTLESAREGFRKLARTYAVAHELHPAVTPLLSALSVEMRRHPEIAEAMQLEPQHFLQVVIDIVACGVETGEIEPVNAEGVVSMFLACTMGLSAHAALMGKARFDSAVDAFARLVEGTLLRAPQTRRPAAKKRRRPLAKKRGA